MQEESCRECTAILRPDGLVLPGEKKEKECCKNGGCGKNGCGCHEKK